MLKAKKGMGVSDLGPIAISFVFIAVVIGVGAQILDTYQVDQVTGAVGCNATSKATCGVDYNVSGEGLDSLTELGSWLPLLALVVAAAVVIGVLMFFRR